VSAPFKKYTESTKKTPREVELLDPIEGSFARLSFPTAIEETVKDVSLKLGARGAILAGWLPILRSYVPIATFGIREPTNIRSLSRFEQRQNWSPVTILSENELRSVFGGIKLSSAVCAPFVAREELQLVLSVLDVTGVTEEDHLLNGLVNEIANELGRQIEKSIIHVLGVAADRRCTFARLLARDTKWVSVIFGDMRGFTPATEILGRLEGQVTDSSGTWIQMPQPAELINQYCKCMLDALKPHGRIDKFIGDGVMGIVGDILEEADDQKTVLRGICTATRMYDAFAALLEEWDDTTGGWIPTFREYFNEDIDLRVGIGVGFGPAVFDFYGSDEYREYTGVGDTVNTAQRLEDRACKQDEKGDECEPILVSQTVRERAGPLCLPNPEPHPLVVTGKANPLLAYGVTSFNREECNRVVGTQCENCPGGQWPL